MTGASSITTGSTVRQRNVFTSAGNESRQLRDDLVRRLNSLPDKWLPEVGVCFTITLTEKERAMLIKFLLEWCATGSSLK